MRSETAEIPVPRALGNRDLASHSRSVSQPHSTPSEPEDRYALACPPGVPLDLWRVYGDRYPGGPRRTRENHEEAERYLAHRRRSAASSWAGLAGGDLP